MSGNKAAADWQERMAEESGLVTVGVPQIIGFLQQYLDQIPKIKEEQANIESPAFIEWKSNVESVFRRTFGEESPERTEFRSISYYPSVSFGDEDWSQLMDYYRKGLDSAAAQIRSAITMLSTMGVPRTQPVVNRKGSSITFSPVIKQENHQSQQQSQTQTLTLDQQLGRLQEIVDTQLDDEEIEQIRELLEKFREKPGVWNNAKKLIVASAGFGRDVAVQIIGTVLAAAALAAR